MSPRKPCGRVTNFGTCPYPRAKGLQRCHWHWLLAQDAMTQAAYAGQRLGRHNGVERARVPQEAWPTGERWCAGCQSFVPLFYASGSRCKGCASKATHAGMVQRTYGISGREYDQLFVMQGGRCYICQRKSKRRLAVDHDHVTGAVRGLLCPDPERGCNHAILGPLEASPGGALAAARRMVEYLEDPPYARLKRGYVPKVLDLPAHRPDDDPPPF